MKLYSMNHALTCWPNEDGELLIKEQQGLTHSGLDKTAAILKHFLIVFNG